MFHTISTKFIKSSVNVDVHNLEVSSEHWVSINNIIKIAEELEITLCKSDTFIAAERELIMLLLTVNKANPRIEEMKFFITMEPKATLVCACISDITTFKSENFLKRNIIIDLHKQNKRLLFTDITKGEWAKVSDPKADKKWSMPASWQANDLLTDKYNKLKEIFL